MLADTNLATIDGLEPGYHPEQGGFAAAGRPEEHHELARLYGQRQPIDHGHRAVSLAHPVQHDARQTDPPAVFVCVMKAGRGDVNRRLLSFRVPPTRASRPTAAGAMRARLRSADICHDALRPGRIPTR